MRNKKLFPNQFDKMLPLQPLTPFLLLGLAAFLRLHNLTWRSLDGDEGASLYFSGLPWATLWGAFANLSIERHPLLYYVLLKGWRSIASDADVALRLPAALCGMVTVALAYRVGKQRLGWAAGGLGALLVAVNPLVIFQNQDARMYAPGLMFSTMGVWALLTASRRSPPQRMRYLLLFVVAQTLAGYSHLIAGLLLPGIGLIGLLELRRDRRAGVWVMGALALAGLLYAPYLWNAYRANTQSSADYPPALWLSTAQGAATTLLASAHPLSHPAWGWILLGAVGLVVSVGIWRGGWGGLVLAAWFVPSLVLIIYITLRIGFFQSKTFAFVAVPLALLTGSLLAGRGRKRAWHWTMGLLALLVLGWYGWSLAYLWRPGYQKEDFRHAAAFVRAQATAQDAVLVHLSWYQYVFGHYYPGPFFHPWGSQIHTDAEIASGMATLPPEMDAVWLVQAGTEVAGSDPQRSVEAWLDAHYPLVTEVYPSGVDVKGYAINYRTPSLPVSASLAEVRYPNRLQLRGYRVPETSLPVNDLWLHSPSTWVHVTLYWSIEQPLAEDMWTTLTLEDQAGNVWGGDLPRPNDLRAFYPPPQWQPGEVIRQDVDVNINPMVPPGEYKLVLRVYGVGREEPLLTETGEDWFILSPITLKP